MVPGFPSTAFSAVLSGDLTYLAIFRREGLVCKGENARLVRKMIRKMMEDVKTARRATIGFESVGRSPTSKAIREMIGLRNEALLD